MRVETTSNVFIDKLSLFFYKHSVFGVYYYVSDTKDTNFEFNLMSYSDFFN
jgi:hypothetical protein